MGSDKLGGGSEPFAEKDNELIRKMLGVERNSGLKRFRPRRISPRGLFFDSAIYTEVYLVTDAQN